MSILKRIGKKFFNKESNFEREKREALLFHNSEFRCDDLFDLIYNAIQFEVPSVEKMEDKEGKGNSHCYKVTKIDDLIIEIIDRSFVYHPNEQTYGIKISDSISNVVIAVGGAELDSVLIWEQLESLSEKHGIEVEQISREFLIFLEEESAASKFVFEILNGLKGKLEEAKETHYKKINFKREQELLQKRQAKIDMEQRYLRKLS